MWKKKREEKKNHTVQLTQLHKLYYCSASAYDDQHSHGYPSLINNEKMIMYKGQKKTYESSSTKIEVRKKNQRTFACYQ